MRYFYALILFLLVVFIVDDTFYVANNWGSFRTQDVISHATFDIGLAAITFLNTQFLVLRNSSRPTVHAGLVLSLFGQILCIGLFSLLLSTARKAVLFDQNTPDLPGTIFRSGISLALLLLISCGLAFWSNWLSKPEGSASPIQSPKESKWVL